MSIITEIRNSGNALRVQPEGEIGVVIHTHPPSTESRVGLPFRQYFTSNGMSTGSKDLRVNGATNSADFYITAQPGYDLYIKFISIKLADPAAKLDKFGALTALTNGIQFLWQSKQLGSLTIHDGIKDNLEFFRMSSATPAIIDLSGGGADAIIVPIDLSKMFGSPWGVKLTKSTTERLIFRVRDDLSAGISEFNIIGHGTKI